jgi:HAE1 family hydrophobic/amphiphilic exporter-1
MTAIATIFALLPLAAGLNEGSIIAAELGTVVIGGLLSSTFLTLIVVPAAYHLIEGWRARRSEGA